ncbi:MAG: DUF4835 family protein [Verrucomicrobia bacterium]|nr:DUF4835 family protein [Cytophagales bacterium]
MKKIISAFVLLISVCQIALAQELRCRVSINTQQMQVFTTMDKSIFKEIEKVISEFMNNKKWTNDNFKPEERIECSILINIQKMPSIGFFEGNAVIQVVRPVFGTNYNSFLFNFVDRNWQFQYQPGQQIDVFNENLYNNNLTSLLAFYAYLIIGMDYDSFAKLGGTSYMQTAFNIANNAGQSVQNGETGWKQNEDQRNRYWLAENLINQQLQTIRENTYVYHRLALDTFQEKPDEARARILDILKKIKEVNQIRPQMVLVNTFFDTKAAELVNLFLQAAPQEKAQVFNLLSELDPTNTDRYRQLQR